MLCVKCSHWSMQWHWTVIITDEYFLFSRTQSPFHCVSSHLQLFVLSCNIGWTVYLSASYSVSRNEMVNQIDRCTLCLNVFTILLWVFVAERQDLVINYYIIIHFYNLFLNNLSMQRVFGTDVIFL